ncbi:MAG: PEP-utilizing enzyme [Patescibacteria group bacterium]
MRKIETIIKRDNSLIDAKAWRQGYTSGLKKWLGWSYSDTLFYIHDGYTEIMRPPQEHTVEFKEFLLKKIDDDPNWLKKETGAFDSLVQEINFFYKDSVKMIERGVDNESLVEIYEKYLEYITKAMGPFITMYWIPNWLENDSVRKEKYKNEIQIALQYRKKTENLFPDGAVLTDKILMKVSELTQIEQKLMRVLSGEELIDYLRNDKEINLSELEKRVIGFIYSKDGIILTDNTEQSLKSAFESLGYEYVPKVSIETKEIRGQSACKGIAKGRVRIIMSKKDIGLLEQGEILVTSMTTPEYLPAMQKSSAFVTDEGGITCHAAIVARELGKPCIIGTKNATQILKNGDMVEVDANAGIIRILK